MVDALTALYQKETGKTVDKTFGGNIGQMLAQVKEGGKVNVVISDDATLRRFDALLFIVMEIILKKSIKL